ncbi:CPBP family intramembrane glutamic endopeptidase [Mastigocoleus testarum]|uniref:Abortive phage infection protein n=1 Tax=Mastigocoleus testarum BC008 TaxID=371196 RepID=A0A0V7ZD99_9CYAN|nr:CPBP family intramembrane glutamic endopeptidase [Mastigocoleus testarum]KST62532.1 abortive phage infection protein [Mastigocoleus testarum BC008]KST69152.1 abortive phage infection protein [Mastigocoleus testarum BC008]
MKKYFAILAQRSFGIRLGSFILFLCLPWLPYAALIYFLVDDSNLQTIVTMVPLAIWFFLFLPIWGKYVCQQKRIFEYYGLEFSRRNGVELLRGLAIGVINILILFSLQGIMGWLVWQEPSISLLKLILEGSLTGLGVALAEELFFRGFIYDELQRDYKPSVVLWSSSLIFAVAHFIKPLPEVIQSSPQFLGLLLLSLASAFAKRSSRGRLGLSIGIHGGLVWGYYIINVGKLIEYSGSVPTWFTGVNNNPLAGIMGLVGLTILTLWMRMSYRSKLSNL